jgi:hypothetical protein
MKTAILIIEGKTQLVLTPESDFEKQTVKTFDKYSLNVRIMSGSFYECAGGWMRQSTDESLILTVENND